MTIRTHAQDTKNDNKQESCRDICGLERVSVESGEVGILRDVY